MMLDTPKRFKRKAAEAFWMSGIDARDVKKPRHNNNKISQPKPLALPTKRRRCVDFDDLSTKVHYRSYDEGDLERCWIQQDEYKEIKEDTKRTLLAIKKSGGNLSSLDVQKHCLRGLEQSIATILFRADRRPHRRIVQRVLRVQQTQRMKGQSYDPSVIRTMYSMMTKHSVRRAIDLARIDAS
ncbi:hypothetical protein ACA910_005850 [Epithemia clementina (nom. ined.)]